MLKLREVAEFERVTGLNYAKAIREMGAKLCQLHRLAVGGCAACKAAAEPMCPKHDAVFQLCEKCEGVQVGSMAVAGLGYIVRRRADPALTWDDWLDADFETEVLPAVGELKAGPSPTSTGAGSPPSSTPTPD